ncbi:hypothetical protein [Roseivivax isoporae]|nr:hypothetical protein [Roseivivax isoporae]
MVDGVTVMTDDAFVLTDLPLGDLLAEELNIDVPGQSIVFILPGTCLDERTSDAELSLTAGRAVAQALRLLVADGNLSFAREASALVEAARIYGTIATAHRLEALGLEPASFCAGLAAELQPDVARHGPPDARNGGAARIFAVEAMLASGCRMAFGLFARMMLAIHAGPAGAPTDASARQSGPV